MTGQRKPPAGSGGSSTVSDQNSTADYRTRHRQDEASTLFGADIGSYGSVNYRLPGDEPETGSERREIGMSRAASLEDFGAKAIARCYVEALLPGDRVTAETLRQVIGDNVMVPGAWGSLMSSFAKQGLLRRVGFVEAARPEAHARVIAVWERIA